MFNEIQFKNMQRVAFHTAFVRNKTNLASVHPSFLILAILEVEAAEVNWDSGVMSLNPYVCFKEKLMA